MPDDPSVPCEAGPRIIPCSRLVCRLCREPVLHLDGVRLTLGRDEPMGGLHASLDPLAWLAVGEAHAATRAYACGCGWTNVLGTTPAGHLDVRDIDGWSCAGHAPPRAPRPALRPWSDAISARLTTHLAAGGWIALDDAYEGLADGRARRHAFGESRTEELDVDATRAWATHLAGTTSTVVARQLAPPRGTRRDLFGGYIQGWSHGELDAVHFVGSFPDVPRLLAALRTAMATYPSQGSTQHVAMPALLHPRGYVLVDEYELTPHD
jgi:hypothetical protein